MSTLPFWSRVAVAFMRPSCIEPVATNDGVGVGVGMGVGVGVAANVGIGLTVRLTLGLGLGEGDAGLSPQPAMAITRNIPASARPVELRTLSTPELALTPCLPP
jgi:hypothetical protein